MQSACEKFGIASENAVAAPLANVGVESEELTVFSENLNYSAQGLANTWPTRFAKNKTKPYVPSDLANKIARNPQAIANQVYSGRLGNGDVDSGDGWRYRGRGPIQITGRDNFAACGEAIGIDLLSDPTQLAQPIAGSMSAAWFFAKEGCTSAADAGNFPLVVKLINGTYPNDANEGAIRDARCKAALAAITGRK